MLAIPVHYTKQSNVDFKLLLLIWIKKNEVSKFLSELVIDFRINGKGHILYCHEYKIHLID